MLTDNHLTEFLPSNSFPMTATILFPQQQQQQPDDVYIPVMQTKLDGYTICVVQGA